MFNPGMLHTKKAEKDFSAGLTQTLMLQDSLNEKEGDMGYFLNRHELKFNEVHFFYTLVDEIQNRSLLDCYRSVISDAEKKKVDRYVFEKDQHTCLVTRALLRFVLSAYTSEDPEYFEFVENDFGKPGLKPGCIDMPINFNLSHSSGVTACALVLDTEIGLDVENYSRKIDLGIADRFFSKPESEHLGNCSEIERQSIYFDLWTLKESYIKAKGMGLSIGLDKFGFKMDHSNIGIQFHESLNDFSEHWQFFKFSPVKNYKAAISVRSCLKTEFKLYMHQCIPFDYIQNRP
jgi:4'-phosphopantetheinyl transferase